MKKTFITLGSGLESIKLFLCSTYLSMKFQLLIKHKMLVLTFISMIVTSESLKAILVFNLHHFYSFNEQDKIHAQLN